MGGKRELGGGRGRGAQTGGTAGAETRLWHTRTQRRPAPAPSRPAPPAAQGGNRKVLRDQVRIAFRKNKDETDPKKASRQSHASSAMYSLLPQWQPVGCAPATLAPSAYAAACALADVAWHHRALPGAAAARLAPHCCARCVLLLLLQIEEQKEA